MRPGVPLSGMIGRGASNAHISSVYDAAAGYVMTGTFQGTITFDDGGPNEQSLTSLAATDVFVAAFDSDGAFQWAQQVGDSTQALTGLINAPKTMLRRNGLIVIGGISNAVATGGQFEVTSRDAADNVTLATRTKREAFLAAWDDLGNLQWVTRFGLASGASTAILFYFIGGRWDADGNLWMPLFCDRQSGSHTIEVESNLGTATGSLETINHREIVFLKIDPADGDYVSGSILVGQSSTPGAQGVVSPAPVPDGWEQDDIASDAYFGFGTVNPGTWTLGARTIDTGAGRDGMVGVRVRQTTTPGAPASDMQMLGTATTISGTGAVRRYRVDPDTNDVIAYGRQPTRTEANVLLVENSATTNSETYSKDGLLIYRADEDQVLDWYAYVATTGAATCEYGSPIYLTGDGLMVFAFSQDGGAGTAITLGTGEATETTINKVDANPTQWVVAIYNAVTGAFVDHVLVATDETTADIINVDLANVTAAGFDIVVTFHREATINYGEADAQTFTEPFQDGAVRVGFDLAAMKTTDATQLSGIPGLISEVQRVALRHAT